MTNMNSINITPVRRPSLASSRIGAGSAMRACTLSEGSIIELNGPDGVTGICRVTRAVRQGVFETAMVAD